MSASNDLWAIVVAAGSGVRFGGPKHAALLDDDPLWVHASRAMTSGGVDEVVVVGDVPGGVAGGERRIDSVSLGLEHVPPSVEFVLVHDAARPLTAPQLVGRVIDRLRVGDVAGVVPVVPVADTLKHVAGDEVVETVDRSSLVAVQTPQGFRTDVLRKAHASVRPDATDDAMLVEAIGGRVVTVAGDPGNLKVTYPEDLELARLLRSVDRG
ncbi:MAG: 2-C-methyl-D-erythritol 4-phosphate cytidylyltransferase [Acidimicrobiia bacterium]|nr:MAG: 2-C-methyl-D-erythritol 4-phosphate cytidylyltransferase [Acidimicrobiia bacterium]